jgi:hypothetical protein
MTSDQATELGKRIINTMRPTPALAEWLEVLEPLDFDASLMTFRDLRDRVDDGLRIAAWHAAYARTTSPAPSTPGHARCDPSANCEHCAGSGFEPGESLWQQVNGEPHEYTTLQPCRCTLPAPRRPTVVTPSLLEEF